ncbi:hypothetical protein DVH24_039356 [Malus domestica]|uniref:Uncharacterized protein n=1 Tax=Malus domestica TaxID=3750 RepID=A0A498I1A8_MALDO|nr:hypothetical protein DVH24_039356 [Malus domestica]
MDVESSVSSRYDFCTKFCILAGKFHYFQPVKLQQPYFHYHQRWEVKQKRDREERARNVLWKSLWVLRELDDLLSKVSLNGISLLVLCNETDKNEDPSKEGLS